MVSPTSIKGQKLIEAGRELFWKHGFRRVSVEEVCQKAGVSKMTFYRYFPHKIELAKAVFDQVVQEGLQAFREIMGNEGSSASEKMEQLLLLKLNGTHDISKEFLADFYGRQDTELPEFVEHRTREVWAGMLEDFSLAQEKGWFRKDFRPEGLLIIMSKINEVLHDESLLQLYGSPQELVMEMARFFSYGIVGGKSL